MRATGASIVTNRRVLLGGGLANLAVGGLARAAEPWGKRKEWQLFRLVDISLFTPEFALKARGLGDPKVLTRYMETLLEAANARMRIAPEGAGASGALTVALKAPGKARVWFIMGDPTREAEFVRLLKTPLEAVPAPAVKGPVGFSLRFDAWGGGGKTAPPMAIPREWAQALDGKGGIVPDDALKVLWPD